MRGPILGVVDLSIGAEIHIRVCECRGRLAEVDRDGPVLISEVHQHEAAATEVPGSRQCDCER